MSAGARMAAVILLAAAPAAAQTRQISGLAAWTLARGANTYDSQLFSNAGFSQHYILGVDSPFLDHRLMKVNAEGSFRTNALTSGMTGAGQSGSQRSAGYRAGGALFPQRSFPLTVQASRDLIDESADYPSSAAIRGGLAIPEGGVLSAFQTTNRTLAVAWQLNNGHLPRIDVAYTKGSLATSGAGYYAEQRHDDIHANVIRETTRIRHTVRYDQMAIDNLQSTAYNQRNNDLDYEFAALVGARSRLNIHSGRRRSNSLFDLPAQVVDPAAGTYAVPSRGDSDTRYAITTFSFEPTTRFSVDTTGSIDRQQAQPAQTGARLVSTSARLEVGGGLSLTGLGSYGDREQIIGARAVRVTAEGGQAGAAFRTGPRWFEASLAYNRGLGYNRTPEGLSGGTEMWSGQATLNSTIGWVGMSVGEDRTRARDDILDYGNADIVRQRATLQVQPGRLTLGGSWDDAVIDRGRNAALARMWQRSASGSAAVRISRGATVTATAGMFTNVGLSGTDTTQFWGGALDVQPSRGFRLSGWIREEAATATQTGLNQSGLVWLGLAEYQLRDFVVAVEYRNTAQDLLAGALITQYHFKGHQAQMRLSRKLAIRL